MTKKQVWNKKEEILNEADNLVLQADILAFESRYDDANAYYDKALKIVPGNADVWAFKGITLEGGLGRQEEALKCWETAKRLDHDIADAVDMTKDESEELNIEGLDLSGISDSCKDKIRKLMIKSNESKNGQKK